MRLLNYRTIYSTKEVIYFNCFIIPKSQDLNLILGISVLKNYPGSRDCNPQCLNQAGPCRKYVKRNNKYDLKNNSLFKV